MAQGAARSARDILDGLPGKTRARLASLDTILFDFDGTVANTIDVILASFRYAIPKVLGVTMPDEVLIQNVGMPLDQQMHIFSPEKAHELVRVYREHNRSVHDEMIKEFPGAKEAIESLKAAGYRTGLVTSKSRELAMRGLSILGLETVFDACVFCDDTDRHKPNPDPVLEALRRLGSGPGASVFVGDSPHDITAGRAARVLTIAALWGPFPRRRVIAAGPDVSLESVAELVPLLVGARSAGAKSAAPAPDASDRPAPA